jgi:hypothetical protein
VPLNSRLKYQIQAEPPDDCGHNQCPGDFPTGLAPCGGYLTVCWPRSRRNVV